MYVLSHPFRLTGTGAIALVEQGSPDHDVELVAALVQTRRGERDLVPDFGIADPTFVGLDQAQIRNGLAVFGPEVQVKVTAMRVIDDTTVAYTLSVGRK